MAKRLVESLWSTAVDDDWHVFIGVDPAERREDTNYTTHFTLPAALYFRAAADADRRLFRPTWAINWLAKRAKTASHFWALNDDVTVNSKGWDRQILRLHQGKLGLSDLTPESGWHSNFPVFTSAHLAEFGTLFHPKHWGWGADHWICRAYTMAAQATWLQICLDHHQADADRQREIQQHQGPNPPQADMIQWAQRITAIAQKNGGGATPSPVHPSS